MPTAQEISDRLALDIDDQAGDWGGAVNTLGDEVANVVWAIETRTLTEADWETEQDAAERQTAVLAAIDGIEGGGGGGDATEAKQDEILAAVQGVQVIQVPSPNVLGNLVLTQGDTYDGVGNPKAQWNVTTDYTDGWSVNLTIRDKDDAVVYTNAGTVDSATVVSVPITTPTVSPMIGCPGSWEGKFDVELSKGTAPNRSVKTIALGKVFINEDQTR